MQPTTIDSLMGIVPPILKLDPTISPLGARHFMAEFKALCNGEPAPDAKPAPELVSRKKAAELLCRSTRAVDLLAAQGHLEKVKMPGRLRACGFRRDEIDSLITGGAA